MYLLGKKVKPVEYYRKKKPFKKTVVRRSLSRFVVVRSLEQMSLGKKITFRW